MCIRDRFSWLGIAFQTILPSTISVKSRSCVILLEVKTRQCCNSDVAGPVCDCSRHSCCGSRETKEDIGLYSLFLLRRSDCVFWEELFDPLLHVLLCITTPPYHEPIDRPALQPPKAELAEALLSSHRNGHWKLQKPAWVSDVFVLKYFLFYS